MDAELQKIREARQRVFRPEGYFGLLLVATVLTGVFLRPVGMALAVMCMWALLQRIKHVAHMPCPRCKKPFGSSSAIPLGIGGPVCAGCGLHLYLSESQT